ncbi:flagellar hook-length control protein FliK [Peribacillus simplex]|uniref:Flagellar hook-length control protein FliK n=2 Tax=Peribacillus TaxID=2675229 RepID=A0AA90SJT0_9BACI|nr:MULTISPECIES: flagellar hook-length control protein FliK [Peribacillus]MDP1417968.1 flagellar hook-length control protein FliK [Peribacillus simplex]MDP1450566.1 flagellar hook-length control protein FliK [Peribacillus frigoritolerans]
MNSAINSLLPFTSLGLKVPIMPNQQTNSGFGSVLQSAIGAEPPIPSDMGGITEGRMSVIKDLLGFLKLERLSDTGEGSVAEAPSVNQQDNDLILQILKNASGNDEGALADFFASIEDLDLEQEVDDFSLNPQSLLSANVMDLYTILKKITVLSEEKWHDPLLSGVVNLLKLVKIQNLLSENKDMTQDEAAIQKQMKHLLDGITGKLEKWLSNQSRSKSESEPDQSNTLDKGQTKPIETLKSVFSQLSGSDKVNKVGTVNSGVILQSQDSGKHQGSGMPFLMTKLEQFVLAVTKGEQTVSQEEFVKQFENILSKANFSGTNGINKLLIRLNPEHLGSLRIELIQKDGRVSAKIMATTAQAKDMLENQIHGLKQAFSGQNIQIERIEISQAFNAFNSEKFSHKDADEHNEQQESKEESNDETESEFTGSLADALLNLEV